MVNYNDGKWHGWNGGECPVHELSVVEVKYLKGGGIDEYSEWVTDHTDDAGWFDNKSWIGVDDSENNPIVAFRVVKEYKEPPNPREFWIDLITGEAYQNLMVSLDSCRIIHVREVLE